MIHEKIKDPQKQKDSPIIQIGLRIPNQFFITKGTGISPNDFHTGSYQDALRNAGISGCNIMKYSSMLPKIATQVKKTSEVLENLVHGSVMDVIEATSTVKKGERATAGIIFGWLYDRKTEEKFGGIVCERNSSNITVDMIEKQLKDSMIELYERGYSKKYKLGKPVITTESFVSEEKFGTAGVWIAFLNYEVPFLSFKNEI